jgi:hypothetical protein
MYDMMTDAALTIQTNVKTSLVTYSRLSLGLQETITSTISIVAFTDSASPQVTVLSISDPEPWSKGVHDGIRLPSLIQYMSGRWIKYDILDCYWRKHIRGAIHAKSDSRFQ